MNWDELFGLVSWEELSKKEYSETPFLINPYVPKAGIVLLWGETSTGKSPLGWHMAAAVGQGIPFFGLPTQMGKVLYIEVDTPQQLVADRLKHIPPSKGVDFLFLPPMTIPAPSKDCFSLMQNTSKNLYDLVIVNTLRKVHSLDDKEAQAPKLVYEYFQKMFPGAAIVFVHHTKKTQMDQHGDKVGRDKESFSGSMAWENDAQVGIQLVPYKNATEGLNLRLVHHKSQVSAKYKPLGLRLESDGATMACPKAEKLCIVETLLKSSPLRGTKLDQEISRAIGESDSTAYRLRRLVETGAFPGVEWLGRLDGPKVEEEA